MYNLQLNNYAVTEFMVYGNNVEKGRNDKIQVKRKGY